MSVCLFLWPEMMRQVAAVYEIAHPLKPPAYSPSSFPLNCLKTLLFQEGCALNTNVPLVPSLRAPLFQLPPKSLEMILLCFRFQHFPRIFCRLRLIFRESSQFVLSTQNCEQYSIWHAGSKGRIIQSESAQALLVTTILSQDFSQLVNLPMSSLNPLFIHQQISSQTSLWVIRPTFVILYPFQIDSFSFPRTDSVFYLRECPSGLLLP